MDYVDKSILAAIRECRNVHISEWQRMKARMEEEHKRSIPEARVVESLKTYIDAVWGGPQEAKKAWDNVLVELKKLGDAA